MTERSADAENSRNRGVSRTAPQLSRLYLDALRAVDVSGAYRIASSALAQGMTKPELYQRVITPALHEIGRLWEKGVLTVADEHLATALTQRVMAALRSPIRDEAAAAGQEGARVMLAAVQGEQHALGLLMAADLIEDAGLQAIYLGADVPTEALLQAVGSLAPDLLALSATMPELASRLKDVSSAVRRAHPEVGLLMGGQAASSDSGAGTTLQDFEALPGWLSSVDAASSDAGRPL